MLTPEQRRALIEAPIIFNIVGSNAYAAGCHISRVLPNRGRRVQAHETDGEREPSPWGEQTYAQWEAWR